MYLPTPLHGKDLTKGYFLKQSLTNIYIMSFSSPRLILQCHNMTEIHYSLLALYDTAEAYLVSGNNALSLKSCLNPESSSNKGFVDHKAVSVPFFYSLSRGINIVNWITMTRKSAEHLPTIYGNTRLLFWPYKVSSAVYTVISTIGDRTSDHRFSAETLQLGHQFISHISDAKSTSHGNCAAK